MNWVRTERFKIRGYEIGPDLRVPLQNLCGYMEEAAALHAAELGFSMDGLARRNLAWALTRLWIEFDEWPFMGGEALEDEEASWITVKTWPVAAERLQYRRDFILTWRGGLLAKAATDWVVINLESRRAERIPEFIAALRPENPAPALEAGRPRLPDPESAPHLASFTVRKSDIDRNNHVNNACFAAWLTESAPDELTRGRLKLLQIVYRAEARYGDTVAARGRREADGAFLQGLFRSSDGRELVRARSLWD
ncbi:MAG: acyl-ACP thioesterase [Candidatus Adiutrix sp.]|nr:acyl-ACP thioesterase [Candidatus Adiutrix sp.]